jgi:hypothetical protein
MAELVSACCLFLIFRFCFEFSVPGLVERLNNTNYIPYCMPRGAKQLFFTVARESEFSAIKLRFLFFGFQWSSADLPPIL